MYLKFSTINSAPDMAEEALRRLGIQKEAAVHIGDSEIDI
jgi:phosphoglycolate phosphatase-like HAD superfamily hydrolase